MGLRLIPWGGAERRQHERTVAVIPCRLLFDDDVLVGKTTDISLGGVGLTVEIDQTRADALEKRKGRVALMLPRGEIEIDCKVVRAETGAVAVQFKGLRRTDAEEELKDFLRTQLSELV